MITVTTDTIPGKRIVEVRGIVKGTAVRAVPATDDIVAAMKNFVGGELEEYTKMAAEAREQALDRMIVQAELLDADAVVGVRFETCSVVHATTEIMCYGTAVVVKDD